MIQKSILFALIFAFASMPSLPMNTLSAAAAEVEYCISGPSSKLVHLRDGPSGSSEEAGLGRGGDCGLFLVKCQGSWCKMQMHDFGAWIEKKDIRKK